MLYIIGFAVVLVVVWAAAMRYFPHTFTLKEGLIMLVVQSVVIGFLVFGSLYGQGHDVQILNGEVISKTKERTFCEHSYQCNCHQQCSGTGKSRSCTTVCDTCYEHTHDYDWVVKSNVGNVNVPRVDRQGVNEPPRWTAVEIGEPFSTEQSYYNYIKASPFSIFNKSALDADVAVPPYPAIHDHYRINRVINFGVQRTAEMDALNFKLNYSLRQLGPQKKVNVVVVFHDKGSSFNETMRAKLLGGKINDMFVVIGLNNDGSFSNVSAFSWSKTSLADVSVRDAVLDVNEINAEKLNEAIASNVEKHYNYRSIEDFKYLDAEVEVPQWAMWIAMLFGITFPFAAAYIAHKHDIA